MIKHVSTTALVSMGLALALLLSACSGTAGTGPSDSPQSNGDTLKVAVGNDLSTGDPAMTGSPADMNILVNIFDSLTRRDQQGKLTPGLALKWVLKDPTTWEFTLRPDVKFSNGEAFDASTVKYSIERVINNPKSPVQELKAVKEVKVVSPTQVEIISSTPDPSIPAKVALFGGMMVPQKYIEQHDDSYFANHPIGTGAYTMESWARGSNVGLVANPEYWGAKPAIQKIDIRYIPDSSTRVAALLNKEVNLITAVPASDAARLESQSNIALDKAPGIRIYYVSIAADSGPLANPVVRQALSYATDTQALVKGLLQGNGTLIGAPLATSSYGNDVAPDPYKYDLAKAKSLLASAGLADGFTVEFDTTGELYQQIAVAVSQMWAKVGVTANVKVLPDTTFDDLYSKGALSPAWVNGYSVWQGDPTTLIGTFFRSGMPRSHYNSSALDIKIDALKTETDAPNRLTTMKNVLTTLHQDAPWIYAFQAGDLYARSANLNWQAPTNQLLYLNEASWK